MRIVFNKNYDSVLSKEMLSLTNIEIVQVNPETGTSKKTQARLLHEGGSSFKRDTLEELIMASQESTALPQLKR